MDTEAKRECMTKQNGTISLIKENAWAIAMIIVGWVVGFALLQQQVNALSEKVAEYPSADFFEERFKNINEKFSDMNKRFDILENKID